MEDEKCYIFHKPISKKGKNWDVDSSQIDKLFAIRKQLYRDIWQQQNERFNYIQRTEDSETLDEILQFVDSPPIDDTKIPAVLLQTNAGSESQVGLFDRLKDLVSKRSECLLVTLSPHDATNLKNLLRTLVQRATSSAEPDTAISSDSSRISKVLNYDLRILQNHCNATGVRKTIITIMDSEAFDVHILTDFLTILQSWLNRINVCLLFGISTSIDVFHERLPRTAIRTILGKGFEAAKTEVVLEKIIESTLSEPHVKLRPGPALIDLVIQRYQDDLLSADAFRVTWHYAMMSHFYGNSLSILLKEDVQYDDLDKMIFEAIRNLPSFKGFVESLIEKEELNLVTQLLQSDLALYQEVVSRIDVGLNKVEWMIGCLRTIQILRNKMPNRTSVPLTTIYTKVLTSSLEDSALLREVLLFAKKLSSDTLATVLPQIADILITMPPGVDVSPDDFRDLQDELEELCQARKGSLDEDNIKQSSAIRQNRNQLKNEKKEMAEGFGRTIERSPAYTGVLLKFHGLLESYFQKAIINLEKLFLSEILFYNLKSPYRDVFTPKPKYAIERALSIPHDYLGCNCCDENQALSSSQPPTAILYQLYLESGALINAYDLWLAFNTIVGDNEQEDSKIAMALFYRGLAELKQLGMIKTSRKKADHLAKLTWNGL